MGPTATWPGDYVGKISPAIPTLRKLVDHMESTVNTYRRYKKHTVRNADDDIAGLMVLFQESAIYDRVDGRVVEKMEKFADILARGFNIVSSGESLSRWFKNRSELRPAGDSDVTGDYDDPIFSELEDMDSGDDYGHVINLHRHVWEFPDDDALSGNASDEL